MTLPLWLVCLVRVETNWQPEEEEDESSSAPAASTTGGSLLRCRFCRRRLDWSSGNQQGDRVEWEFRNRLNKRQSR